MDLALHIQSPDGSTRRHPLGSRNRLLIGRGSEADIALETTAASRKHAELVPTPSGGWMVRDLASRNGTRVNGQAVRGEQLVLAGDVIEIADFRLTLSDGAVRSESTDGLGLRVDESSPGPASRVRTFAEFAPTLVRASHLSRLTRFGRELSEVREAQGRRELLCALLTSGEFPGQAAVVLRISCADPSASPQILAQAVKERAGAPYISRTMLRLLLERREPVLASNVASVNAPADISISAKVLPISALACPLEVNESHIDALYVMMAPQEGTQEWLAAAALAAEQFQHAETIWRQRRQAELHAQLEHELKQAHDLQQRLLPAPREIAGLDWTVRFEPCRWIGGDYVDVMTIPDGRVALIVADVCGHGLQAALMAFSLHSVLRAHLSSGADVSTALTNLNAYLCQVLPPDRFVTLCCTVVDPATRTCESVSAGHPPAIAIDANGKWRPLAASEDPPLGTNADLRIAAVADCCSAGEIVAMYTDGLIEVGNEGADMIGYRGFGDELGKICAACEPATVRAMVDGMFEFVASLQDSTDAPDDRALLLARFTSAASPLAAASPGNPERL